MQDEHRFALVTIQAGKYFVTGDNRDKSADSRYFGFADRAAIIGRLTGVIVSWDIKDGYLPRMGRSFTRLR